MSERIPARPPPAEDGVKSKVARLFEAFNERDLSQVLALTHPAVEFVPVTAEPARDGRPYVGHQGMHEYFSDMERVWEELTVTAAEMRQLADGVLVLGRVLAHSKKEGTRDLPVAWILRLNGDRFVYGRVFTDPREAERELGSIRTPPAKP
jgi:ketosteroid isomerase-like protein